MREGEQKVYSRAFSFKSDRGHNEKVYIKKSNNRIFHTSGDYAYTIYSDAAHAGLTI